MFVFRLSEVEGKSFIVGEDNSSFLPFEQVSAGEEHVHHDACGEDVAGGLERFAFLKLQDFGREVAGSAALVINIVLIVSVDSESEIDDYWLQRVLTPEH